jgi:hypothetical protein
VAASLLAMVLHMHICPECLSEMGFHINTIEGNKLNSEEGKMK